MKVYFLLLLAIVSLSANAQTSTAPCLRIAYIDIDTFEAHYTVLIAKKAVFEAQKTAMERELQSSGEQLLNRANEAQKKVEAGKFTEAEAKEEQQRLSQMQESLESRKQAITDQLAREQETFNADLRAALDAFLEGLAASHHLDFILTYSKTTATVLYANKGFDITREVIKGMNEAALIRKGK